MSRPCALYRHYDADGALLYVGVSANPKRRLWEHKCRTEWARKVARSETVWFGDKPSALAAEAKVIYCERPAHNSLARIRKLRGPSSRTRHNASNPNEQLLSEIDAFLASTGMGESYFGKRATGNSELVKRLRDNGTVTLKTAGKVRSFIQAHKGSRLRIGGNATGPLQAEGDQ